MSYFMVGVSVSSMVPRVTISSVLSLLSVLWLVVGLVSARLMGDCRLSRLDGRE